LGPAPPPEYQNSQMLKSLIWNGLSQASGSEPGKC
jgi:hypothetical protein